ncbi:LRR receptor-like serine/threonine-protein kinase EFR isoform X2 [Magnolia sinica]|uniref:LRR receptor-like serine/threonine-protein kinase EFR isoform X2 n=1 Tax=Magnolia sinica TaxID=86752 RepID=UPI002659C4F2|nr:LRR receptor-like serine/threonine-protein kinase EFR isoform X2 [Magnolia sinica]
MGLSVFWSFIIFIHVIHFLGGSLHSITVVAATFSNETDRFALLAFKDQIANDPLRALSSWNNSLHFCKWQGVTCRRRRQRVTALNLRRMELKGLLSLNIANLTFLWRINLQENKFHGPIPQDIGRLFHLRYLNLSQNNFQGQIPINITKCSNLRVIDLGHNDIVGEIPVELSTLPKLTIIDLQSNKLVGSIPPSFGNISSLTVLSLLDNSLGGSIPVDLSRIPNLEFLEVSGNRLSGIIPSQLYNLSSLLAFSVTDNSFSGRIPSDIGLTLPNLEALLVGGNRLTGPIPRSLGNALRLEELELTDNGFSGPLPTNLGRLQSLAWLNLVGNQLGTTEGDDLRFLASLTNCSDLTLLGLEYNNLKGVLPDSVGNLSIQLEMLTLSENQIFGSIPNGIGNLAGLTQLTMDHNRMTGSVPVSIGKLQSLQVLDLSINRFSGNIPFSVGNMSLLGELYLAENNLQGFIPPTLGNCRNLYVLNLSQNSLHGDIPKQVFSLVSLTLSLSLDGNFLTGRLPEDVGDLKNIEEIHVARNRMSGEIPQALGDCLKLEHLSLEGNFFNGTIPRSLNTLKVIQILDLSDNNLSGQIPKYLEEFRFLQYLNLSFNDLDGEVPQEGVFRNLSASSVLGNKKVCGGIPVLQLPSCPITASKKRRRSLVIKVVIAVFGTILCLLILSCLFGFCYWRKKPRKRLSSTSSLKNHHFKVSYAELLKATNAFSSSNLIGFGSYSSVYKGVLDPNEMIVAVKVLNLQQRGASKSFITECEALRNIRHRNLVKVLTSCSSIDFKGDHFKALVLEFMPNGSLEKWLHPQDDDGSSHLRKLSLIQRLNIAIDVASALEYLHHDCQTPVIHRDLKPSNVLLDADMIAHVGDFGLARLLCESDHYSQNQSSSAVIKGTIGYVAPGSD